VPDLSLDDAKKGLKNLLERGSGSSASIACAVLDVITTASSDAIPDLLKYAAEQFKLVESANDVPVPEKIPESDLPALQRQYGTVGDSMLFSLIFKNPDEVTFYKGLWDIVQNPFFQDTRAKGYTLYNLLIDNRLPYFPVRADALRMAEEEYQRRLKSLEQRQSIAKIRFLLAREFEQSTQQADELLRHINEETEHGNQVVLMTFLIREVERRTKA
jgi:hypothetical protein